MFVRQRKSRVKPLGTALTVPKMELTAATLATVMAEMILKELEGRLKIDSVSYWTDSTIVLGYIRNESRRFVTFVLKKFDKILAKILRIKSCTNFRRNLCCMDFFWNNLELI